MTHNQVVRYYKTASAAAEALGIHRSNLSRWKTRIPRGQQLELERLTGGKLKAAGRVARKGAARVKP